MHEAPPADWPAADESPRDQAVYTIRYPDAVYVLHVFQKKSTRGIATPRQHIDLVKQRLKEVAERRARENAR